MKFLLLRLTPLLSLLILSPMTWAGTLVEISAQASQEAPNDRGQAVLFIEASGPDLKTLSSNVNNQIASAQKTLKAHTEVKSQSGSTTTTPIYNKEGRIKSWTLYSEIVLESGNMEALSEAVGKLQGKMGVSSIEFTPAPETRKKAEDIAIQKAIAAFRERANLVSQTFDQSHEIKKLDISTNNHEGYVSLNRVRTRIPAKVMVKDKSMPVEAGESLIQVSIHGQIELMDQK